MLSDWGPPASLNSLLRRSTGLGASAPCRLNDRGIEKRDVSLPLQRLLHFPISDERNQQVDFIQGQLSINASKLSQTKQLQSWHGLLQGEGKEGAQQIKTL